MSVPNRDKYEFSHEFQTMLLAIMARYPKFTVEYRDSIDSDYFENHYFKVISRFIIDHSDKYGLTPTRDIIFQSVSEYLKEFQVDQTSTERVYSTVDYIYNVSIDNAEYYIDKAVEFGQTQALKKATIQVIELLDKGDIKQYGDARMAIEKALSVGCGSSNVGTVFGDVLPFLQKSLNEDSMYDTSKRIPTGMPNLDMVLGGGLAPGEIGVVVGPTGVGKSITLINLGIGCFIKRKPLVYYTLELKEMDVIARITSRITGLTVEEIRMSNDDYSIIVRDRLFHDPILIVKYFKPKSITTGALSSHLSRLKSVKDISPGLVIVDYADKMRSPKEKEGTYLAMGDIYENLIGIGFDFDCPIWTASQTNRHGVGKSFNDIDSVADSYKKMMDADVVITIGQDTQMKIEGRIDYHLVKSRRSEDFKVFNCTIDYPRMLITEIGVSDRNVKESFGKGSLNATSEFTQTSMPSIPSNMVGLPIPAIHGKH